MIRLRAIEASDLPQLRDWRNADWLRSPSREYRLLNLVNQHDWLEKVSRSRAVEMFGILVEEELVGVCGLCNISWVYRTAEVSIYVAAEETSAEVRVLGLLKQIAFEEFNLHRLWAEVYEFHAVKIALLEQHGFVLEGRLREHTFKHGQRHDSLMYGLLRRT